MSMGRRGGLAKWGKLALRGLVNTRKLSAAVNMLSVRYEGAGIGGARLQDARRVCKRYVVKAAQRKECGR